MNATQIHLAFTHVPVILAIVGLVILIVALIKKSDILTKTAYYMFLFAGLFAIPVFLTGEGAEEIVEKLPGVSENIVEEHEDLSKIAMAMLVGGMVISLLGLLFYSKASISKIIRPLMLIVGLAVSLVLLQTAHLGGQIRHTEIRPGFSSQTESNTVLPGAGEADENE